ncbi:retrovirus-related pol polyprotein from transposon TNT 1-94 [Tanacetum coccineum]
MSQEKEAQTKFHKTHEDKELEKIIALENKIKALDDIVYKTGQSVQTMNMLNRNCRTSFVKPKFLKKAQLVNPRLYDIGCYNDNLALMLAPESDETIHLKAQLQDKGIAISELKKLIEKMKGKSVETKFEKSLVIRQPNAFKSQRQSILESLIKLEHRSCLKTLGKPTNPHLKSNRLEDRVMHNNSKGKKQQVEDHRRNFNFSNNKTSVTVCNDSLNAKTLNVNFICVTCGKCVMNDNHDMYVLHYINGVNSRTKMPMVVPINTREPKRTVNQSVATPLKRTVAAESTNQKPRSIIRKQYEQISKTCTVKFRNDQIAPILGYGDLDQGNITIKRVYYVEGLNHNLFFVGQFCDTDLEVAFRKSTCYIYDLKYDIVPGLPKLKFVKDHLCSSCELGKAKQGILHQTSTAQTPEQNSVVERQNRTLVEAARTMLSAAKVSLFFWAEAIATTCFTQNRSLVIPSHEKTPYHIINGRKPSVKFFHILALFATSSEIVKILIK